MTRKNKSKDTLTPKEEELMQLLWQHGPMCVKELVELYPEPHPHVNTVSTVVRTLEEKGYVGHEPAGIGYRYFAIAQKEDFRNRSLKQIIKGYFDNSYINAVSSLVENEQISIDELRSLIDMIEKQQNK